MGGPPLGLFDDVDYAQATLTLRPGDILVLYTDGITEAMDSRNRQFGLDQLNASWLDATLARPRCEMRSSRPSIASPAATPPTTIALFWSPRSPEEQ